MRLNIHPEVRYAFWRIVGTVWAGFAIICVLSWLLNYLVDLLPLYHSLWRRRWELGYHLFVFLMIAIGIWRGRVR